MSKRIDNATFEELVVNSNCEVISYEEPISQISQVQLKCFCGRVFSKPRRSVRAILNRTNRATYSGLNCGCSDKKWTNAKIDELVTPKQIQRLTNCDVPGLQPSVTKLDWKCLKCEYEWKVAVDSLANKDVGCPQCAGNLTYTVTTLQQKLIDKQRTDLLVLDILPGNNGTQGRKKCQVHGKFKCVNCQNVWTADIHNVIKFGYGCPTCNDNISTRVYTADGMFRSKLEYYFWESFQRIIGDVSVVQRQVRYVKARRFTCDYVIPTRNLWIEISGKRLLARSVYYETIQLKRKMCEERGQTFVMLTSIPEIHEFLYNLKETI